MLPTFARALSLLVAAATASAAVKCDDLILKMSNQADIDTVKACPKIDSMFFSIDHNFTGPFVLDGVETIPEFMNGYLGPKLKGQDRVDDKVTTVSLPDTKTIGGRGLLFGYMDNLTSISFPKVETINSELGIIGSYNLRNVTMPSLVSVGKGIFLDGHFDTVDFPSLKSAAYLKLSSTGDINCTALGHALAHVNFTGNSITGYKEFTCWAIDEKNRWNSSNPGGSYDRKSAAHSLRIGYGFIPMVMLLSYLIL